MRRLFFLVALFACTALTAQNRPAPAAGSGPVNAVFDKYEQPDVSLDVYFSAITNKAAEPDSKGFIRRWALLEPIPRPDIRSNTVFTDSWLKTEFAKVYFEDQASVIPKDGQEVTIDEKTILKWHWYDSKRYNVKLYRFASGLGLRPTEGLFMAVTVVNCKQDMKVRLAAGSNSASMWWVNGQEVLLLSGDRRMVVDDGVSRLITLKKGKNIIRCSVINGPGMSDFCVRFIDEEGKPVTDFTVSNK